MARRPRFHSPDGVYHVMLRGNDGQQIFFSEDDKSRLCLLLQQGIERFNHSIEAFCFMSNHIQLAIQVANTNISKIIHHLAFCYTQYINRLYKRVGHLFQGRFKSILVDDTTYLKELIRYIHLNPVRAGIVSDPQHYLWSSHKAYMGLNQFLWLSKDRVLAKFHYKSEIAIIDFERYVLKGVGIESEFDFKTGCTEGMLGERQFIDDVLKVRCLKPQRKVELSNLIAKVCERHNVTCDELCMPGKYAKFSQIRALIALLIRELNHISLESLGQFLGRDPSGLSKLANRLEVKISKDPTIAKNIQELRIWLSGSDSLEKISGCQA